MIHTIDLSGVWGFGFEQDAVEDEILLPGTTETGCKGQINIDWQETRYLSRVRPFTGKAWYTREVVIPQGWQGKTITLHLERTKYTTVYVDGMPAGSSKETIVPQVYNLSALLSPGIHTLAICVDNDLEADEAFPRNLTKGHQYTDHTQTNWNGMTGQIELRAAGPCSVQGCVVIGQAKKRRFRLKIEIYNAGEAREAELGIGAVCTIRDEVVERLPYRSFTLSLAQGENRCEVEYEVESPRLWDEFHPAFYDLCLALEGDTTTVRAGFCETQVQGRRLLVNGVRISLRGTVDCAIFPATGYAPTTKAAWREILLKMQEYGLNHYRFHSWCPPEAAFAAADELGVYLQAELPCFASRLYGPGHEEHDPALYPFLESQARKVLEQYGNHPSFLLFATGNEMRGEPALYQSLVRGYRAVRADKLYMQGSNNFFSDPFCMEGDDAWVVMRTGKQHNIRASFAHSDSPPYGCLQTGDAPNTMQDYTEAAQLSQLPLLAHEVGQYQVFPDPAERYDYTGPLCSTALKLVEDELREKGLLHLAPELQQASGKLAALCYREDIEGLLRTEEMSGFQLLGLQDFPGQGTALVGILDSFFRSKGLIAPEQWRQFCAPQVLLGRFDSYVHGAGGSLGVEVEVYNYGAAALAGDVSVGLYKGEELLCETGLPGLNAMREKLTSAGSVALQLPALAQAVKCELRITFGGLVNSYPIWVYPERRANTGDILVTDRFDEVAQAALQNGGTVALFSTGAAEQYSEDGFFATDFWCYPMFKKGSLREGKPVAPGTMGLLVDAGHGALEGFPTEGYAEWQWHALSYFARPVHLDALGSGLSPIVRVIDNCDRNESLALLLEARVDNGRLLISTSDVLNNLHKPEVQCYYNSIIEYLKRDNLNIKNKIEIKDIAKIFN